MSGEKQQLETCLTRGVAEVYPTKEALEERMGKHPMRVYLGVDPTSPYLHIGHAIGLRKLAEFQKLGHEVILLIGSFTAMIGDPTDKSAARKQLTQEEVLQNAATYKKQASKILSFSGKNPAKIMFNHKWLGKMTFADVVGLSSHFTVQQMSERDMFEKRLKEGKPVFLHEFLYPLMQGYDSVEMDVDLEIGGSDQTFNMLTGRTLMRAMAGKEKFVLTTELLTNDEGKKMSKSEGGFIALNDTPEDMYGKVMAMDDSMIVPYFALVTDVPQAEVEGLKVQLSQGVNPRDVKARLAHEIVTQFHSKKDADQAEEHFDMVFRQKAVPEDVPEFPLKQAMNIIDILVESGLTSSKSDARRMIEQGAVKVDGVSVTHLETDIEVKEEPIVLQKGKRHFIKLIK